MSKIISKLGLITHESLERNVKIDTMLVGKQILLDKPENDLQYSVKNLNDMAVEFSMDVNTGK
jgi:hypothetical protein